MQKRLDCARPGSVHTKRRRIAIRITSALAAPFMIAAAIVSAPIADAEEKAWPDDYDPGCDIISWGFLGSQERMLCDGPKRPDGSWTRGRLITVPAHIRPSRTTCSGTYSVTCTHYEKRYVDTREIEKVHYDLTDDTVPPGEPGWIPSGVMMGNKA
ncbi:hypothetical protein SEA_GAUGELDP_37 [Mycobacterium phage GaugeLDP]|nr:hypothetical protein SEA_GAUGELDP_37 [Mycobacterium phage GaugeLDP]